MPKPESHVTLTAIRAIVQEEMRPLEERLDAKLTTFKDQILTSNDKLARKLNILLTETATTGHRLTRLEHHTGLKPRV